MSRVLEPNTVILSSVKKKKKYRKIHFYLVQYLPQIEFYLFIVAAFSPLLSCNSLFRLF